LDASGNGSEMNEFMYYQDKNPMEKKNFACQAVTAAKGSKKYCLF
jgi:hypothetical protein